MSTFSHIVFFISALLIQNVFSQYFPNRNIYDPILGASGIPISPYQYGSYNDLGLMGYNDPYYGGQGVYIPEQQYGRFAYPEYGVDPYGRCGCEDYALPEPVLVETCDYVVDDVALVEDEEVADIPFISAVGFGGDTLAMALNPLLDAADANVALLMFTKVRTC